ncbi:MAG: helix-turn-helix domain-containing protein, partial [Candidatus Thiodiazotropha sp. (ex Lucinoma borealis)]|nr:helix-turn-helix domain-containing protein [Candidatus Thiodiazotropha sp. (ex Lucinoma borealis)]
ARHDGSTVSPHGYRGLTASAFSLPWRSAMEGRFPTLKEAQQQHIEEALERAGGNQGTAAALLGISRPALNRRLARIRED